MPLKINYHPDQPVWYTEDGCDEWKPVLIDCKAKRLPDSYWTINNDRSRRLRRNHHDIKLRYPKVVTVETTPRTVNFEKPDYRGRPLPCVSFPDEEEEAVLSSAPGSPTPAISGVTPYFDSVPTESTVPEKRKVRSAPNPNSFKEVVAQSLPQTFSRHWRRIKTPSYSGIVYSNS